MDTRINVYTGPMFCGKTNSLLSAYERAVIAEKKVLAFKPRMDNRFSESAIKSRKFGEIPAINIENISELLKYDVEVYIIDEFQFLDGDATIIRDMANMGKVFYIAGLDMTAEGKPFGQMPELLAIADSVYKMVAICAGCKRENAVYSFFLGKKSVDIVVGNNEYVPLCRECWAKRMKEKAQTS